MHRIAVINDLHCGHLLGLTPPEWHRNDCIDWAVPFWDFFTESVDSIGPVDDLIINGDAIDGPGRKGTTSHLTTDIGTQIKMAAYSANMLKAKRTHVVRGTGFHTDGDTAYEDFLASELSTAAHDELRLEISGRLLHFRHVVGRSDIPYGQHTQLQKELINDILRGEFEDYQSADTLIRAHVHYCFEARTADSTRGIMRSVYTAPCLQLSYPLQSEFTRRLRTWKYDAGITVIDIERGFDPVIKPILFKTKHDTRRYTCLD